VTLGRGEECDTVLPGHETSRRHAEVRREGPIFVVRDLESRNGIHLNGTRITEGPIEPGDVLRLGEWVGIVGRVSASGGAPSDFGTFAPGLFGGPTLGAVLEPARRAAPSDLPIIVQGETGVGKERVARAIHEWSGRKGPFVAVNCAALVESLAEGELFGYRRGAFTGAERASAGHFRSAHGGTLLLDEIVDLPLALQAKVLRVLQEREVTPVGESLSVGIDVRIIVAAQTSLERAVVEGRFRADLFARLEGLVVSLPPLRERIEEVPYLFARFVSDGSGGKPPRVEAKLVEQLCLHDWPFNVRELAFTVKRLLILDGHRPTLERSHLPERILSGSAGASRFKLDGKSPAPGPAPAGTSRRGATQDEVERLAQALRDSRGNVAHAAAALGITRQRAYRMMEARLDVDLDELREEAAARGR
jgi:sigma-54 dependent transcriptional regulator, acetoin dehydrogenase operon transcriptional activator AcoR